MKKPGRKRIYSTLGDKKRHTFNLYDLEFERLKIEYNKIKKDRPNYYIEGEHNDN